MSSKGGKAAVPSVGRERRVHGVGHIAIVEALEVV
jgi:hypothetical protein